MSTQNFEIRIQAQTADGISIGLIEPMEKVATKEEINARIDMYVEVVGRQRAKAQLIAEKFEQDKDEVMLKTLEEQLVTVGKTVDFEAQNRSSGKAKAQTEAQLENIKSNINHVKAQMEKRKKGIKSLESLAA